MLNVELLVYAFSAGMVATVNPCGIAMLPAYISYYLATDDTGARSEIQRLARALLVGLLVAAGFVVLFALAGAVFAFAASMLVRTMPWLGFLVGIGLFLLGLWLFSGRKIHVSGLPTLQVKQERSFRAMFLFGVAYGLTSLSCTLPVFLLVVGSAFTQEGFTQGLGQFIAYGLGMGLVLMALTIGLALFREMALTSVRRVVPYVHRVSSLLLSAAGIYIVYYWLTKGGLLLVLRDIMAL